MNDKEIMEMLAIMKTLDESVLEDYYLKGIRRMNKKSTKVLGVAGLHMMIVADRGRGRAQGLLEYTEEKTDIESVKIVRSIHAAKEHMISSIPDLVVFAAMQDNVGNYSIPEIIRAVKPTVFPAMYAAQDPYVEKEARKYDIHCVGDCVQPTEVFLKMLKKCYWLHLKNLARTKLPDEMVEEKEESGLKRFWKRFR